MRSVRIDLGTIFFSAAKVMFIASKIFSIVNIGQSIGGKIHARDLDLFV